MAKETKPKNIRATEETHDRFAQLAEENFPNQGAALEALINAWEIQNAKNAVPEREADITDFDSHIQALQRAFIHSLDIAQNAENRARDELRRKLEMLETDKAELQKKLEEAETREKLARSHWNDAMDKLDQERKRAEAAEKYATALEAEKANTTGQLADKQKLIDNLSAQLTEALTKAQMTNNLQAELTQTKHALDAATTAAQIAEAKATAEQAQAVATAQLEASARLLELTEQNAALRTQMEQAKARITLLESPKEMQTTANIEPTNNQQTPPPPTKDTSNAAKRQKVTPKREQKKTAPQTPAKESKGIPGLKEARDLTEAWAKYNKAFRASFEGKNAVGGMTDVPKPATTLDEYLKDHPAAAAYLRAENESLKTNDEIASIGKRALDRIKANPDDYAAAITQMETDFAAYSDRHMWD